ncbi:subclass B1 metallo-beta-lactamase [Gramella sp. KN1008]|uniref:subclass B1 metallo-beta-lactamase n=1 Tax=Gramella sp. KN1008 TaxID=2529298 RepID=UPI001039B68F|nr:subclass B1 metallo-beta-lactamase [Gramella sp. KN1008]TBW30021.1 subclass B1 metallo-beta-lactamase [Gramella sp. KN1008]
MRKYIFLVFCLFVFTSATKAQDSDAVSYSSDVLKIEKIGDNVFKHVSYLETEAYGKVACNGMIFIDENEAIVYDTPTTDGVSAELINWIENIQQKRIKAVVISHFHADCLGGIGEFHKHGIRSYAHKRTIALAREKTAVLPKSSFRKRLNIKVGDKETQTIFFGTGHTRDNVVGYIPEEKVLFGGCLIKQMNAGKGNLEDADVDQWALTVKEIREVLPDIKLVLPGHGKEGGAELLDYTIELFKNN